MIADPNGKVVFTRSRSFATLLESTDASDERRKSIRFPINVDARLKGRDVETPARSINISSGGALFSVDNDVPLGSEIEAHIHWPVSLSTCDLKLVISGVVVWSRDHLIAIRRDKYDFKTVASKQRSVSGNPPAGSQCS